MREKKGKKENKGEKKEEEKIHVYIRESSLNPKSNSSISHSMTASRTVLSPSTILPPSSSLPYNFHSACFKNIIVSVF